MRAAKHWRSNQRQLLQRGRMRWLRNLHYYFIAMRHWKFEAVPCALCKKQATKPVLTIDRYLLPVHVAVCTQCGLVHTSRNMTGEALQHFYRDHYRRYYESAESINVRYLFDHKPKLNAAYRMTCIREVMPAFSSVLEIGSGLGYFLDTCRTAGVKQLLGLELGDTFCQYARETLGLGKAVQAARFETLDRLPFAPQLVVLFHVFEHLEDPTGCLRWIAQHMAADGMLVIEVPDITGDWRSMGLRQFHTAHRWYFSPVTLSNMLAANGFTPVFITRDDGDGIYPGNLRIFARRGDAGDIYPLVEQPATLQEAMIRARVPLMSMRNGIPRAMVRLVRQAIGD
jgi:SAM-dependent methyltransferase